MSQLTQKQKHKLARKHGGFNTIWWEERKYKTKRRIHDIQTKSHIMAQIRRGETPTLLNGDPLPNTIKRKPKEVESAS